MYLIRIKKFSITLNSLPNDSTSISDDNIIRVFKDSKDNMWFGTTSGLSEYCTEIKQFYRIIMKKTDWQIIQFMEL